MISPTRRPAPETHARLHSARFLDAALAHQSRDVGVTHRPALDAIVDNDAFSHEFRRRDASETRLALEKFDVEDVIVIVLVSSSSTSSPSRRARASATRPRTAAPPPMMMTLSRRARDARRARGMDVEARRAMNEESRPTAPRATVRRARRSVTPQLGRETRANVPWKSFSRANANATTTTHGGSNHHISFIHSFMAAAGADADDSRAVPVADVPATDARPSTTSADDPPLHKLPPTNPNKKRKVALTFASPAPVRRITNGVAAEGELEAAIARAGISEANAGDLEKCSGRERRGRIRGCRRWDRWWR